MFQCGMDFQSIPLYIKYSSQHFELIQYANGLFTFLFAYQVNDPKVIIDLDDFPSLLCSIMAINYTFLLEWKI
jgi:hypothetical protein